MQSSSAVARGGLWGYSLRAVIEGYDDGARERAAVRPGSGGEIQAVLNAERRGLPFLVFRDGAGQQTVLTLEGDAQRLTVGRHSCDISLPWDDRVSATHAVLERLGQQWALIDDGLSRNGTYINGERVRSRQRLADRDSVRMGSTPLTFRQPYAGVTVTLPEQQAVTAPLTPMQHKVLIALCRPRKEGGSFAAPASNTQIAAELVLSIDAIKSHMRGLFERFGVTELAQNQKRAKVVERAFTSGIVTERDL